MDTNIFKAAIIQTNTANNIDPAFEELSQLVRAAAKEGAQLVATPEGSNFLERDKTKFTQICNEANDQKAIENYSNLARELGIELLIGSALISQKNQKAANRSLFFSKTGDLIGQYDKIHLFDVNMGNGMELMESNNYDAGDKAVLVQSEYAKIGLTICYDIRFSYLYRFLAQSGAQIISIPAAFTVPTGMAHWEVLLRARAIETNSFILAPAQVGTHMDGRKTYGNSMIINPWGEIIAKLDGENTGFAIAQIDLSQVADARAKIPAWSINKEFKKS